MTWFIIISVENLNSRGYSLDSDYPRNNLLMRHHTLLNEEIWKSALFSTLPTKLSIFIFCHSMHISLFLVSLETKPIRLKQRIACLFLVLIASRSIICLTLCDEALSSVKMGKMCEQINLDFRLVTFLRNFDHTNEYE